MASSSRLSCVLLQRMGLNSSAIRHFGTTVRIFATPRYIKIERSKPVVKKKSEHETRSVEEQQHKGDAAERIITRGFAQGASVEDSQVKSIPIKRQPEEGFKKTFARSQSLDKLEVASTKRDKSIFRREDGEKQRQKHARPVPIKREVKADSAKQTGEDVHHLTSSEAKDSAVKPFQLIIQDAKRTSTPSQSLDTSETASTKQEKLTLEKQGEENRKQKHDRLVSGKEDVKADSVKQTGEDVHHMTSSETKDSDLKPFRLIKLDRNKTVAPSRSLDELGTGSTKAEKSTLEKQEDKRQKDDSQVPGKEKVKADPVKQTGEDVHDKWSVAKVRSLKQLYFENLHAKKVVTPSQSLDKLKAASTEKLKATLEKDEENKRQKHDTEVPGKDKVKADPVKQTGEDVHDKWSVAKVRSLKQLYFENPHAKRTFASSEGWDKSKTASTSKEKSTLEKQGEENQWQKHDSQVSGQEEVKADSVKQTDEDVHHLTSSEAKDTGVKPLQSEKLDAPRTFAPLQNLDKRETASTKEGKSALEKYGEENKGQKHDSQVTGKEEFRADSVKQTGEDVHHMTSSEAKDTGVKLFFVEELDTGRISAPSPSLHRLETASSKQEKSTLEKQEGNQWQKHDKRVSGKEEVRADSVKQTSEDVHHMTSSEAKDTGVKPFFVEELDTSYIFAPSQSFHKLETSSSKTEKSTLEEGEESRWKRYDRYVPGKEEVRAESVDKTGEDVQHTTSSEAKDTGLKPLCVEKLDANTIAAPSQSFHKLETSSSSKTEKPTLEEGEKKRWKRYDRYVPGKEEVKADSVDKTSESVHLLTSSEAKDTDVKSFYVENLDTIWTFVLSQSLDRPDTEIIEIEKSSLERSAEEMQKHDSQVPGKEEIKADPVKQTGEDVHYMTSSESKDTDVKPFHSEKLDEIRIFAPSPVWDTLGAASTDKEKSTLEKQGEDNQWQKHDNQVSGKEEVKANSVKQTGEDVHHMTSSEAEDIDVKPLQSEKLEASRIFASSQNLDKIEAASVTKEKSALEREEEENKLQKDDRQVSGQEEVKADPVKQTGEDVHHMTSSEAKDTGVKPFHMEKLDASWTFTASSSGDILEATLVTKEKSALEREEEENKLQKDDRQVSGQEEVKADSVKQTGEDVHHMTSSEAKDTGVTPFYIEKLDVNMTFAPSQSLDKSETASSKQEKSTLEKQGEEKNWQKHDSQVSGKEEVKADPVKQTGEDVHHMTSSEAKDIGVKPFYIEKLDANMTFAPSQSLDKSETASSKQEKSIFEKQGEENQWQKHDKQITGKEEVIADSVKQTGEDVHHMTSSEAKDTGVTPFYIEKLDVNMTFAPSQSLDKSETASSKQEKSPLERQGEEKKWQKHDSQVSGKEEIKADPVKQTGEDVHHMTSSEAKDTDISHVFFEKLDANMTFAPSQSLDKSETASSKQEKSTLEKQGEEKKWQKHDSQVSGKEEVKADSVKQTGEDVHHMTSSEAKDTDISHVFFEKLDASRTFAPSQSSLRPEIMSTKNKWKRYEGYVPKKWEIDFVKRTAEDMQDIMSPVVTDTGVRMFYFEKLDADRIFVPPPSSARQKPVSAGKTKPTLRMERRVKRKEKAEVKAAGTVKPKGGVVRKIPGDMKPTSKPIKTAVPGVKIVRKIPGDMKPTSKPIKTAVPGVKIVRMIPGDMKPTSKPIKTAVPGVKIVRTVAGDLDWARIPTGIERYNVRIVRTVAGDTDRERRHANSGRYNVKIVRTVAETKSARAMGHNVKIIRSFDDDDNDPCDEKKTARAMGHSVKIIRSFDDDDDDEDNPYNQTKPASTTEHNVKIIRTFDVDQEYNTVSASRTGRSVKIIRTCDDADMKQEVKPAGRGGRHIKITRTCDDGMELKTKSAGTLERNTEIIRKLAKDLKPEAWQARNVEHNINIVRMVDDGVDQGVSAEEKEEDRQYLEWLKQEQMRKRGEELEAKEIAKRLRGFRQLWPATNKKAGRSRADDPKAKPIGCVARDVAQALSARGQSGLPPYIRSSSTSPPQRVSQARGKSKVTLLPGDGVGPELMECVQDVFNAADVPVEFEQIFISEMKPEYSVSLETVVASLMQTGVCLKGNLDTLPESSGHFTKTLNIKLRQELDLFANVVHIKNLPGLVTRHKDLDFVVIREYTEGEYSAMEHESVEGVVECLKIITHDKSMRIAKFAFDYAMRNGRQKVTAVHKAPVMQMSDGLFLDCCDEVSKMYPDITYEKMIIDLCCSQERYGSEGEEMGTTFTKLAQEKMSSQTPLSPTAIMLVSNPQQFDVMVMPNLYGNIVDNLAAGLVGGAGVVPGESYSEDLALFEQGARHAFTEATGKNIANPTASLLSACNMLKHMHLEHYSLMIHDAVHQVLQNGKVRTRDVGGHSTTTDFTRAVIYNIRDRQCQSSRQSC